MSNKGQLSYNIRRANFAENLLKQFNNADWRASFRITFLGEEGIDAGGLRREFFDTAGSTLKNP